MKKKIIKTCLYTIVSILAMAAIYIAAVYLLPYIPIAKEKTTEPENITIYLITNGAHTDIVVPAKNEIYDWTEKFAYKNTKSADSTYRYLGIGWGDKAFYLDIPEWSDLTFTIAFKAGFWLSSTAIHATYHNYMIEGEDCKKITITQTQYLTLINYINSYLITNEQGSPLHIKTDAVYSHYDAFYDAKGKYSIFFTCNTWTNTALKKCGQKACLWTALDDGIFYQYSKQ